jgi:hypothetical protein
MNTNDLPLLTLNCFVLGDDEDQVFTVKIPKTDNVSILKKLIKEENLHLLAHVDAKDLELWNVSFPIDNLSLMEPSTVTPKLRSNRKLLSFADDLLDDHVHILVKVPRKL